MTIYLYNSSQNVKSPVNISTTTPIYAGPNQIYETHLSSWYHYTKTIFYDLYFFYNLEKKVQHVQYVVPTEKPRGM